MMTSAQRQWKRRSLLLSVLYFVAGYFVCAWLVRDRVPIALPMFEWERSIPFVPEAIWSYLLPYPVVMITYWILEDFPTYRQFVWRYVAMLTVHLACFLLLPAVIERPLVTAHGDFSTIATALYFAVDPPRNLFPSFHVSLPLLCRLCTWSYHRVWSIVCCIATAVVAASVLLVKQHYAIDILGAVAVVTAIHRVCPVPCVKTTSPIA